MRVRNRAQEPVSAQAVLDGYARVKAGESDPREPDSINLFLQAGARVEAQAGLAARLVDLPADSYAEAVLVEIACWDPSSYAAGREAASEWLLSHTDPGLTGYVQARADFLNERALHAEDVGEAAGLAQLSPFLALLIAGGLVWGTLRMLTGLSSANTSSST